MTGLRVSDFDYDLPAELIAQQPPTERGQSRMLVMNRATGDLRDATFAEFPSLLSPGDLLVLNNTRVIPARLYARRTLLRDHEKPTGQIEVMLTEPVSAQMPGAPSISRSSAEWVGNHEPLSAGENLWRALVRPGRKVAIGEILIFPARDGAIALEAEVIERGQFGERLLRFKPVDDFFAVLDRIGHVPLPPYIRRDDEGADRERYQTVFSHERGSVAAPTAGLHFTPQILDALTTRGVEIARLTLHVGLGTFAPLRVERVDQVHLHRERYTPPPLTPSIAQSARAAESSPAVPRSSARWSTARFNPRAVRSNPTPAKLRSLSPPASNSVSSPPCSPTSIFLNRAFSCSSAPLLAASPSLPPIATLSSTATASSAMAIACSFRDFGCLTLAAFLSLRLRGPQRQVFVVGVIEGGFR